MINITIFINNDRDYIGHHDDYDDHQDDSHHDNLQVKVHQDKNLSVKSNK